VLAIILVAGIPASNVNSAVASQLTVASAHNSGEPVSETLEAVSDSMIASGRPAVNFGSNETISVGYFSGDGVSIYRGLARFDLSGIPAEAVIVSADMSLYADDGTVSKQIQVRRLTGAWSESSVNWNNQPQSAAPEASRYVGDGAGAYAWNVRQTVQDWVSGAQPNNGFLLRAADESESGYRNFRSREAPQGVPNVANVRLVVTWMLPVGLVDPGAEPLQVSFLPLVLAPPFGEPLPVEPSPCPELPIWTLLRGMDAEYYQQSALEYDAAGFRPLSVTVEGEGDQARFNVIWVKDGLYGDMWNLRHDMTSDELQDEHDAEEASGFRPAFVDAYGQSSNTRYVAAWVDDDLTTHMMAGYGRTDFTNSLVFSDTLQGWTLAPEGSGWRPLWVSVNGAPGDPRFSAIFAQDDKVGVLDFDKTFAELQELNGKRTSIGYRLLHLSGYLIEPDPDIPDDDGVRYAASWTKDPDECGYVKWQVLERQEALKLDLEALNASGIRAKTFNDETLYLNSSDLQNAFRRRRFEISAEDDVTLSSLSLIEESIPGVVFEDGDVILLQPKIGQIITVKEEANGNIDLMAADDGADGGQKFVMRGYNYILSLEYDTSSNTWVEMQRNGLPHERYWPISVDEFSDNDERRYNSVWVQHSPDRTAYISYAPGDDPSYFQTLDAIMQDYMEARDIPGGALAVTKDGRLVMARGYTWEPDGAAYVGFDAKFRLASVTKPLTSAAVTRLMEAEGISLDTPIYTIIGGGWSNSDFQHVTVRQLLLHLGGWDRDIAFDPMFIDSTVCEFLEQPLPVTPQMIIDYMKTQPMEHEPGTVFSYTNFGYSLLGRLIEALSGQTYNDYMRNNFFIPFDMLDTWPGRNYETEAYWKEVKYYSPRNSIARDRNDGTAVGEGLACNQDIAERVMLPYGGFNIDALDAHGAWVSTTTDVNRFLVAINDGSLLDSSQYAAVFQRPEGRAPRVLFEDGGSPVDMTIPAQTPGMTWPAITGASQYLYVGKGHSPFSAIDVKLSIPGAGYTLKIDYWDGATFVELTEDDHDLVDETENLSLPVGQITFTSPENWLPHAIGGQTRYWLRVRTETAASTAAEFDLLEPTYDNKSFYGFGWFVYESEHRLNFQAGTGTFSVGEWVAGTASKTVAQVKDIVLLSPPGVTPTFGYLILENVKGGPFRVDEVISGQNGSYALTDGPGVPETFSANHDGILDGSRAFMYRRSDGVTWAALFNLRVGDSHIPLYMPGGTVVGSINSEINDLTIPDWPVYNLFP
jgi:CubicO group peptidase (beta-lactamase class C family)